MGTGWRALAQLEEEVALREGPMMQWNTNLKMMASKERQYLQQLANYKVQWASYIVVAFIENYQER